MRKKRNTRKRRVVFWGIMLLFGLFGLFGVVEASDDWVTMGGLSLADEWGDVSHQISQIIDSIHCYLRYLTPSQIEEIEIIGLDDGRGWKGISKKNWDREDAARALLRASAVAKILREEGWNAVVVGVEIKTPIRGVKIRVKKREEITNEEEQQKQSQEQPKQIPKQIKEEEWREQIKEQGWNLRGGVIYWFSNEYGFSTPTLGIDFLRPTWTMQTEVGYLPSQRTMVLITITISPPNLPFWRIPIIGMNILWWLDEEERWEKKVISGMLGVGGEAEIKIKGVKIKISPSLGLTYGKAWTTNSPSYWLGGWWSSFSLSF